MFSLQPEGPQEGQLPPVDSFSAGEGASSSDPADHGWRQGKAEAPVVRSRAFQLTTEEARAAPDVVTGMILSLRFIYMML